MAKSQNKNIKVFLRFFPLEKLEMEYLKVEGNTVYMRQLQELSKGHNQNQKPPNYWEFKSDGVFFNVDQKDMYANVMDGVLERIVAGDNGIILAYGQTRSGKTVTIGGLQLSEQDFGIIPRVLFDLFKLKSDLPKNIKMCIQMSYTEFSYTTAADLLKHYPYSMNVYHSRDATKIKIKSEFDGLKLLFKGEGRKTFAGRSEYLSNICSTVVTFHVTTTNTDCTNPTKNRSRLHIIDLAGVDTVGNTSCAYKHAPDIGKANVIKTNLERFVLLLRKNIPFYIRLNERANPLIYYLGSDLSNESIFRFIGHIRTPKEDLAITISLLRFGQKLRGIKPKHKEIIVEVNEDIQLQHLQNQIEDLETEKLHDSVLLNQDLTKSRLDKNRLEHLHRLIKKYLKDEVTEITVLNVAEASDVFNYLKQMCNECEVAKYKLSEEMQLELAKHKYDLKTSTTSLKTSKSQIRRAFKKSRETISTTRSSEKKMSSQTLMEKKSLSKQPSKKSSQSLSQINKKGSSLSAKRSSLSNKKKSTTSASTSERRDSKTSQLVLLPDIIPGHPEAWNLFIKEKDAFYNTLLEQYRANETELQETYAIYSTEMRKLQCLREIFERRRNELYEAQMIKKFCTLETYDSSQDQLVVSSTEKLTLENYSSAEKDLVEQQEIVLRWQSEIKIGLNRRIDIKKHLNEEFDIYCKEKFSTTVPSLGEEDALEETTKIDIEIISKEPEEDKACIGKQENEIRLDQLKKMMEKELIRNMKIRVKEMNKWKNYPLKTS